jgi:predicted TPR repeat methyltransferase
MSKQESSKILEKVYSAKDNESLVDAYNEWAENYDEHVTSFGYKIPSVAAALFGRYVNDEDSLMLDAGAGTGIMGEILYLAGYANWIGIDMTPGMLKLAEARNVYKSLRVMTLGEKLNFADNEFEACQSIGVFTAGHRAFILCVYEYIPSMRNSSESDNLFFVLQPSF